MGTSSRLRVVKEVASRHDPDKVYNVYEHRDTHALSCQCGHWVFNPTCHCETKLRRHHEGDHSVFTCPVHGRVPAGPPQSGKAQRSCPHIRKHLADEAYQATGTISLPHAPAHVPAYVPPPARQVARQRPTRTPGGQYDGPLVPLLMRAAKAAGLLDEFTEWRWRQLAEHLAPFVADGLPAAPAQAGLDLRPVRRIYLED